MPEPVDVPTAGAADVLVSALCEACGTWHHLRLVDAPETDGQVKVRPVCWACGHRPMAVVHAVAGTIPRAAPTPSVETACTHDGSVHTWREGCPS